MINERPQEAEGVYDDSERWLPISVDARVQTDGRIVPLRFEVDGHHYPIERILDERIAKSRKEALTGTRYLVRVQGRLYLLYHDRSSWFLELKRTSFD